MPAGGHTLSHYLRKHALREGLRALIAPTVRWEPLRDPREGYSVLIGCHRELGKLLLATLATLGRQRTEHCKEVILSIDGDLRELGDGFEQRARSAAGGLPLRFLELSPGARRIIRRIDWGPVYAWNNWARGVAACTTRHALLHDLDALLIDPSVLEERYRLIRERNVEYLGIAYHGGGGTKPEDRLCRTFELILDAAFVRAHHRPIDVFNKMWSIDGRRVEFDTFLYCQHRHGTRDVAELHEERMVHPSNMIGQYTDYRNRRDRIPPHTNLPMIPYYEAAGGDDTLIVDLTRALRASSTGVIDLWNWTLRFDRLPIAHRQWMRKQATRVETLLFGGVRPNVHVYFDAIEAAPHPSA